VAERSWEKVEYRYGFGTQEKDNEITGINGTHYTAMFWEYDTRLGRRWNVDPLTREQPSFSPYKVFYNNPNFWIDRSGETEEERLKAVEEAKKKIGTKYKEAIPEGGQFDCSGLVRYAMMKNKTISDPYSGTSGNGVSRIMEKSTQIQDVNDIEIGNVVVIKSGGNENGHIMLITEVNKVRGKVESYKVVHAEIAWTGTYGSGGGDVNETTIHTDGVNRKGETYSKSKYNHRFYKWDTPDKETTIISPNSIESESSKSGSSINNNSGKKATNISQPLDSKL